MNDKVHENTFARWTTDEAVYEQEGRGDDTPRSFLGILFTHATLYGARYRAAHVDVQIAWVFWGWADDPTPHFLVFANPSTEVPTHARPVNGGTAWDASPYITIVRI